MVKTRPFLPHLPYLLVIWILAGAVYLKTLPPSILYIDAGTMIAAAASLGIPNPPGFPSYVMVAHLFTLLPFESVLFKVQLLSLLSALGVLTLVYLFVQRSISHLRGAIKDSSAHLGGGLSRVCALASALILAFSYQFWSQTLNTESYIFTNLLMMGLLTLVLTAPVSGKIKTWRVMTGAVLLGVASGANPTIVQVLPALGLALLLLRKRVGLKNIILMALIAIALTALVYSYLPIRASQYPFLNWGNPQTRELFIGHLKGEGLDINDPRTNSINGFTGSPQIFAQSVGRYFFLLLMQFTPVLVPLIFLGIYCLYQKNKSLLGILLTIPLTNLIFGGLYLSGNQESWFIASYIIFAILLGIGLSFLLEVLLSLNLKSKIINRKSLIFLPFLLVLIPLVWYLPKLDRSSHIVTSEYADNLYSNLPKNTVLIGSGDFFNSLSLYEHEMVKRRSDVFPVVANMWYILPWYRDNLRHQRPDLMPSELEGMIKKDRLEEYNEVMNWYIRWLLARGHPVYVTPTVFTETVLAGTDAGRYVPDKSKLKNVPLGLAYRMLMADDLLEPVEESFNYRFNDPLFYRNKPFYLERNYNAAYHLLLQEYGQSYLGMADFFLNGAGSVPDEEKSKYQQKAMEYAQKAYDFAPFSPEIVNRMAIFSAMQKDIKAAAKYFRQALALSPGNLEIRLNLAKALSAMGQTEEAKKEFTIVVNGATDPTTRDSAQAELSKLATRELSGSVPEDWQKLEVPSQGFSLRYPGDWKVKNLGAVTVLEVPGGEFSLSLYGGKLARGGKGEDWVKGSPIKFSGKEESRGLAQIPPFDATAVFWLEGERNILEFVLVKEGNILHIKAEPVGGKGMEKMDQILSTINFK